MKNKISVIFFTFRRAIILESALSNLIKNSGHLIDYPINIIYHYDQDHSASYKLLKKRFKNKIKIYRREKQSFLKYFLLLFRPFNLVWILRYPWMLKNFTNFKEILETILYKKKSDLVMMCTDDTIFYKKVNITKKIFKLINNLKNKIFFRSNFGLNLKGLYYAKRNSYKNLDQKDNYIFWNANNKNCNYHMRYHFQVEGAVYHRLSLLNFLKPILYHNPITLEALGYREAKLRGFFENTISERNRSAVTYEINSVQKDTKLRFNYRMQLNPVLMMKAYLNNYVIHDPIPFKIKNLSKIIPKVVYVVKRNKKTKKKNILNLNF